MSVFRPSNINRRLVGTATTISGSPGNGGQLGPKKTPYIGGPILSLGGRFQFGCCSGVFKTNESRCGRKEDCQCASVDCKGFFICCGPSTTKWFVAPACAEVSRGWPSRCDAITVANSCLGACGWFVPTCTQLKNPGFTCNVYWDVYGTTDVGYWSLDCSLGSNRAWGINMSTGSCDRYSNGYHAYSVPHSIRAFRCTAT